ncbi:MAG TPA: hypothetical protein VIG50_02700 [Vicinamibacteria bacterium]|jgi:hypothetical protein
MPVHIREAAVSMHMVDGDSLFTPAAMQRIVAVVARALQAGEEGERARRRDTRIGGCEGGCDDGEAGA